MQNQLTIEYDGTAYAGWQRQENALAVQQVVEEAAVEAARGHGWCSPAPAAPTRACTPWVRRRISTPTAAFPRTNTPLP